MSFFRDVYEGFVLWVFFWAAARMWSVVTIYAPDGETAKAIICTDCVETSEKLLRNGMIP